jgi:hypothetical protein
MMNHWVCPFWANTVQQGKSMRIIGASKTTICHHFQWRKNLRVFYSSLPKRQGDTQEDNTHQDEAAANEVDAHT